MPAAEIGPGRRAALLRTAPRLRSASLRPCKFSGGRPLRVVTHVPAAGACPGYGHLSINDEGPRLPVGSGRWGTR